MPNPKGPRVNEVPALFLVRIWCTAHPSKLIVPATGYKGKAALMSPSSLTLWCFLRAKHIFCFVRLSLCLLNEDSCMDQVLANKP